MNCAVLAARVCPGTGETANVPLIITVRGASCGRYQAPVTPIEASGRYRGVRRAGGGEVGGQGEVIEVAGPSEWVEAALEQAELVAFWIGEDVPGRLRGLTDVDEFRPGGQEALELGILIAVGGVDVDVQPGMPVLRLVVADEEDRRLRAAEPIARTYLDAARLFAIQLHEVQDLAPEPRQHLGVAALEHELTDTACH
jgi:hypothetical protein